MNDSKNIDRLFQEHFKDFEVAPPPAAWNAIKAKLDEKEKSKRAVSPFWLKLCGTTAVFFLGVGLGHSLLVQEQGKPVWNKQIRKTNNTVVTTNAAQAKTNNATIYEAAQEINIQKEMDENGASTNAIATVVNTNITATNSNKERTTYNKPINSSLSEQESNSNYGSKGYSSKSKYNTLTQKEPTTFGVTSDRPYNSETNTTANTNAKKQTNSSGTIASAAVANATTFEKQAIEAKQDALNEYLYDNTFSKLAFEAGSDTYKKESTIEKRTRYTQDKSTVYLSKEQNERTEHKASKVSITHQPEANKQIEALYPDKDTVAEQQENKNKALAVTKPGTEVKKVEEASKTENRWMVQSSVAPIFFNLNGAKSTIDPMFNENAKSYQSQLSYGVGLGYQISKKIELRTGIQALKFNINTKNIVFYDTKGAQPLTYVTPSANGFNTGVANLSENGIIYHSDGSIVTTKEQGLLNQQLGYIEIPLELAYKLVNTKLGIDVIGGFSSLFLTDNRISVVNSATTLQIGEANNLNTLHFSANMGLGFRYQLLKSLQANLDPMFKYQINTFNRQPADVRPYFIGIYTGLSYKF